MTLPAVIPTVVVLPLPGLVGDGSLAKWINRRGLKKGSAKHQLQAVEREPVEAAYLIRSEGLMLRNYSFLLPT